MSSNIKKQNVKSAYNAGLNKRNVNSKNQIDKLKKYISKLEEEQTFLEYQIKVLNYDCLDLKNYVDILEEENDTLNKKLALYKYL